MTALLKKYSGKLGEQGLCERGAPLICTVNADVSWNREDPLREVFERVLGELSVSSLLFAPPAEPYASIIEFLERDAGESNALFPEDSETRTFLHDIPIVRDLDPDAITAALRRRKCALLPGHGIVSFGTVSPEQAFVTVSSVCFSLFVKFFADLASAARRGEAESGRASFSRGVIERYRTYVTERSSNVDLAHGPFTGSEDVAGAIAEAGRLTVEARLVDSFFGNISYRHGDMIYISQTGSSLDELAGCIDPCPIDNSSCAGLTASSEFSAHREIYSCTDRRAILHGHPRFAVIMSMACDARDHCAHRTQCHRLCPEQRFIRDIPVVPGEVGTGRYGICTTMPPALKSARGAIVYGHGLFTTGTDDFNEAFSNLISIELMCIEEYLGLLDY